MAIIIRTIFEELEKEAISTELIQLPDVHIKPCRITQSKDCLACMGKDNCVFKDDDFYEIFEKIKEADGLILGSPVYGVDISAEMKIFLDRLRLASIGNPDALRHKPGTAVCAVCRAGGMNTVNTMNNVMLFREMFLVGSTYWNMVYGKDIGDVLKDDEGMANMRNIGQNMAWLIKQLWK
ncbi:flavodoxin family protein [Faecalitalea cylindroides]|uniref:flavodoxin family protein n=1 Tax=Faecalitalea cylindroides TaxID=39483 RepID=UPI0022E578FD|nr:flavodoxin family protein [Faecalitalea cylindroides]